MKKLYFCMFDVYISLPSWPNIIALLAAADRERFSAFGVDRWVQISSHLNCAVLYAVQSNIEYTLVRATDLNNVHCCTGYSRTIICTVVRTEVIP
jgi:hypothetical protein